MHKIASLMKAIKNYYSYFFLPLILLYLFFNIFDGNNGLLSHSRLNAEIAMLETKVENIKDSNRLYQVKITSLQKYDKNSESIEK